MRASSGSADPVLSAAHRADAALRERYAVCGAPPPEALDWNDYDALIEALAAGIGGGPAIAMRNPLVGGRGGPRLSARLARDGP